MGENKEESLRRNLWESQIPKDIRSGVKRNNSEVPEGQFQRRPQLASKGMNSEVPAGNFAPTDFEIQILVFIFGRWI